MLLILTFIHVINTQVPSFPIENFIDSFHWTLKYMLELACIWITCSITQGKLNYHIPYYRVKKTIASLLSPRDNYYNNNYFLKANLGNKVAVGGSIKLAIVHIHTINTQIENNILSI